MEYRYITIACWVYWNKQTVHRRVLEKQTFVHLQQWFTTWCTRISMGTSPHIQGYAGKKLNNVGKRHIRQNKKNWNNIKYIISLYCFLSVQYLNYISVFQLISLNIFYKQHIKTYVLSKTLKISPTCFGHLATIFREIPYLSLLQLLNYRCSIMPASDNRKWMQACCCIYSLVTEVKTSIVSPWGWSLSDRNM